MKNIAAALVVLLFLSTICCARTYSPLSEMWSHPVRSDSISFADVNSDGISDIFVASYGKHVSCVSSFDHSGKVFGAECLPGYSRAYFSNAVDEQFSFIRLTDFDRDGVIDAFASSFLVGNEVNVQKFYILHRVYDSGLARYEYDLEWQYDVDNVVTDVAVADLNNDSRLEIAAGSLDTNVYILNLSTSRLLQKIYIGSGVWSLAASDLDGNVNNTELVVGAFSGIFCLINQKPDWIYALRWSYPTESRVISVVVADVNGDGLGEVAALSLDRLYLLDSYGGVLWSKTVSGGVDVAIKDIDNDGDSDILVLAKGGIYSFDAQGGLHWTYPLAEQVLSLEVDFYNNIFVGSAERVRRLVSNQDFTLNEAAEESYLKAHNFYLSGEYSYSNYYALRAKKMFEMVNNEDGIARCDYILTLADSNSSVVYRVIKAGEYYASAVELLAAGSFEEARSLAQLALDIYVEVKDKNRAVECDVLLAKISSEELSVRRLYAAEQYQKASASLDKNLFAEAYLQAQEALSAYSVLGDSEGVRKSESLLSEIKLLEKLQAADSSYNLAIVSQQSADYSSALMYAEKARGLYLELGDAENAQAADSLGNFSRRYIEAGSYYDLAMEMYHSSRFDNATVFAEKARAIYSEMGDIKNVDRCDFIITSVKNKRRGALLDYLVLAAPIALIVLFIVFRRQKMKKESF